MSNDKLRPTEVYAAALQDLQDSEIKSLKVRGEKGGTLHGPVSF